MRNCIYCFTIQPYQTLLRNLRLHWIFACKCKLHCRHQKEDLVVLPIHLRNGIKKASKISGKECLCQVEFLHVAELWSIFRCLRLWTLFLGRNPAKLFPHHGIRRIDLMMQLDDQNDSYMICIHYTLYHCSHSISDVVHDVWKHKPTNKSMQAVTLTVESDFRARRPVDGSKRGQTKHPSVKFHPALYITSSHYNLPCRSFVQQWRMTPIHLTWILILCA